MRQTFIKAGFTPSDTDAALSANQYRTSYPALADNPPNTSLEGFLYPDSYQRSDTTAPQQIVEEALNEMQTRLTANIRAGFASEGLTVYQGVTLASIVEKEVPSQADRNQVAEIFLKRLGMNMPLDSDASTLYGAIEAGVAPNINYPSPYNTYLNKGLPPSPIGTVSTSSLEAVAHPATTDWLYFVSGDNGKTYYATTLAEQQSNVANYCKTNCNQSD